MGAILTGEMLADWADRALELGAQYWYGTCWYRATEDLLRRKGRQYPAHYSERRMPKYERHVAEKRMVCDCVGLIKGFFWTGNGAGGNVYGANGCPDASANGMYALCRLKGGMAALPETRGAVLWRKGHIGVYVGGGMAIEARGFDYGVVRTAVAGRGWSGWGLLPEGMIAYGEGALQAATPVQPELRRGMRGEAVARAQALLIKWDPGALPRYGADGDFGSETRAWVERFQRAKGLAADGIVGPVTWGSLEGAV